jgi:hypothetical protein
MPHSHSTRATAIRLRVDELESRLTPSVAIRFDYTFDNSGFFSDPARKAALQRAADLITPHLQDDLAAIVPSGANTWEASLFNPVSNTTITLHSPTIRENEIVIYVMGAAVGNSELGVATTGGYSATGSRLWLDTVRGRGQAGALATPQTEYSVWGGLVAFDTARNWNFSTSDPAANQYDFASVAQHEILHILGFGLGASAFTQYVVNGQFTGPDVEAVAGGPVAVDGDPADHWAPGTTDQGQPSPMQPALPPGVRRTMTPLDFAALRDIGWDVSDHPDDENSTSAPSGPAAQQLAPTPPAALAPAGRFAVGNPDGANVYGAGGELLRHVNPFSNASSDGVRVAMADVNGDGVPDLIAATGPGQPAIVTVSDGKTGAELITFQPFESAFTGGVFVAAADLNADGKADLAVSADRMGGPVVAVYDGAALAGGQAVQFTRFLGIDDAAFRGGARVALGDVNGDGTPDLVVAAGTGGGPRVAIYDGRDLAAGGTPRVLVRDFFAFEPDLRNGVYVTVADLDGDGRADVIVGAGSGGAPRVTAFRGAGLLNGEQSILANFFAGDAADRDGIRVAARDVNADGQPDLLTGSATDGRVAVYAGRDLLHKDNPPTWLTLDLAGPLTDGVYVG